MARKPRKTATQKWNEMTPSERMMQEGVIRGNLQGERRAQRSEGKLSKYEKEARKKFLKGGGDPRAIKKIRSRKKKG